MSTAQSVGPASEEMNFRKTMAITKSKRSAAVSQGSPMLSPIPAWPVRTSSPTVSPAMRARPATSAPPVPPASPATTESPILAAGKGLPSVGPAWRVAPNARILPPIVRTALLASRRTIMATASAQWQGPSIMLPPGPVPAVPWRYPIAGPVLWVWLRPALPVWLSSISREEPVWPVSPIAMPAPHQPARLARQPSFLRGPTVSAALPPKWC
jgi:hypothetical protein